MRARLARPWRFKQHTGATNGQFGILAVTTLRRSTIRAASRWPTMPNCSSTDWHEHVHWPGDDDQRDRASATARRDQQHRSGGTVRWQYQLGAASMIQDTGPDFERPRSRRRSELCPDGERRRDDDFQQQRQGGGFADLWRHGALTSERCEQIIHGATSVVAGGTLKLNVANSDWNFERRHGGQQCRLQSLRLAPTTSLARR